MESYKNYGKLGMLLWAHNGTSSTWSATRVYYSVHAMIDILLVQSAAEAMTLQ